MTMKSFNDLKVAVCFSGQSRTYEHCAESIHNFFQSRRNNKYHFFGHTTNLNCYKIKRDNKTVDIDHRTLDINSLKKGLESTFAFEKLLVEEEKQRSIPYGVQLYSAKISNFLKQQYEIENNMMFDLVVKARFDICYKDGVLFEDCIHSYLQEKCLYGNFGLMDSEFLLPNVDSIIYFGTSLTMDIAETTYDACINDSLFKIVKYSSDNPVYKYCGDGLLIYKWAMIKNLLPRQVDIPYSIFRESSIGMDYKTQWDELHRMGWLLS